jgi:hypothetical protein
MPKSNPQIKIVNCETGEEIVRDATAEEIAQLDTTQASIKAQRDAEAQKAAERLAIAERLGLSADELKTLLG